MSKRARRSEAERIRCRSVLWQRKQTQLCHTNPRCSTRSATCRNQSSSELGFVGSKTVYITDSQQVKKGIEAILQGKKKKTEVTQRSLEENCCGTANHKVEKVKAHQSKKQREEETLKQASARKRNEEADKRAVEAAARNASPSELAERRKKINKIGKLIQTMMLQIMEKIGQIMKSWGHSVNNDVATFRVMEAGRSDDNLRELIEKEGEQKQKRKRGCAS